MCLVNVIKISLLFIVFMMVLQAYAASEPDADSPKSTPPLFEHLGTHHHEVTTRSPQAQQYFDQGLRFLYAFNYAEADRAFEETARLDPQCAMAYWGISMALGPSYNNMSMDADHEKRTREAATRAMVFKAAVSPRDQAYIEAVVVRYPAPPVNRASANEGYAAAMGNVWRRFPDDPDAGTLYAEALMDLHPWHLWSETEEPTLGTLEIMSTLDTVLEMDPDNPGANHYYIHTLEASPYPERALAAAYRLPKTMPGASHLVHMPAHIYIRTGQWAAASHANEAAVAADHAYLAQSHAEGREPVMLGAHNSHFLAYSALMEGRSAVAYQAAQDVATTFLPFAREEPKSGMDGMLTLPLSVQVRFGRWGDILLTPRPPKDFVTLTAFWHFARGLAFARTGQFKTAEKELTAVSAYRASLKPPEGKEVELIEKLLTGELAAERGQMDQAIRDLKAAVTIQDALGHGEIPAWLLSARLYLGAALLKAGQVREADTVYDQDLKHFPNNGWALFGKAAALRQLGAPDAADVQREFDEAWPRADVKLTASRF